MIMLIHILVTYIYISIISVQLQWSVYYFRYVASLHPWYLTFKNINNCGFAETNVNKYLL